MWFKSLELQNELHTSDSLEEKRKDLRLCLHNIESFSVFFTKVPILLPKNGERQVGRRGEVEEDRRYPRDSQQLDHQGLLVHHVGRIRHVETSPSQTSELPAPGSVLSLPKQQTEKLEQTGSRIAPIRRYYSAWI